MPTTSGVLSLGKSDFVKAIIMAVFMGAALPIAAAIQTPGFNLFQANWSAIFQLSLNGAGIGFVTYLAKNVLSDSNGALLGKWGGSVPPSSNPSTSVSPNTTG